VQEVMLKLNDPKYTSFSLLGIALDSGFNSKSAFNRFFKKATGLTPSDYKKSLQNRDNN
jgi:AraC-like DNA-binding protein